ncbi:MAG: DUF805 domain-containing protein [Gammaproteobacteria bacterium]
MANINWGNLLFGFSGRINRAKWWLTILITIIINVVVQIIVNVSETVGGILAIIAFIVVMWIGLAAGAKRLHDLNRTAAWLVVFYGVPFLLLIVLIAYAGLSVGAALLTGGEGLDPSLLTGLGGVAIIIVVLIMAVGIWSLIWLGCLRGTVGPNQYGPDPLEGRV